MKKVSSVFVKMILFIALFLAIVTTMALVRGHILFVRTYYVSGHSSSSGKVQSTPEGDQSSDVSDHTAVNVKIVALADLHGEMVGENQERIVRKVKEVNPDFIVYLGDMVEKNRAEESVDPLVVLTEKLVQIAPVFYVDGNHEQDVKKNDPDLYARLNEALAELGAVQLADEIISFTAEGGDSVNLCGITRHYHWRDSEQALMGKLKKMDGVNVLACHYPESVIWYNAFDGGGLDVALCGHTHGGLIRVPFIGGMYAPEQSGWPMYDLGAYLVYSDTTWKNYGGGEGAEYLGTMIISGGLAGEHGVPRVNNPMEVSVVEVE